MLAIPPQTSQVVKKKMPEGWTDSDEADGLPEDQDEKHFCTDEGKPSDSEESDGE
jgi:hypothetical protein